MMTTEETIVCEKGSGIAVVTLNRPQKRNAVTVAMKERMLDILDELEADDEVKVVVVTGAGKAFCAGADIGEFEQRKSEDTVSRLRKKHMLRRIYEFEKPIIGAINGAAAGEGSQWLLAFDMNVAAEEATLSWPATRLGTL